MYFPMRKILFIFLLLFVVEVSAQMPRSLTYGNSLIDAADTNNIDILKALIARKQDVNSKGKFQTTALHRAIAKGNYEAAKILLENNANPNLADLGGATALHIAARSNDVKAIKLLLEHNANINAKDKEGLTPLHRATAANSSKAIEELTNNGANPNIRNDFGDTPLIDAVKNERPEIVRILVKSNADVDIKNNQGVNALDEAVITNDPEISRAVSKPAPAPTQIKQAPSQNIQIASSKTVSASNMPWLAINENEIDEWEKKLGLPPIKNNISISSATEFKPQNREVKNSIEDRKKSFVRMQKSQQKDKTESSRTNIIKISDKDFTKRKKPKIAPSNKKKRLSRHEETQIEQESQPQLEVIEEIVQMQNQDKLKEIDLDEIHPEETTQEEHENQQPVEEVLQTQGENQLAPLPIPLQIKQPEARVGEAVPISANLNTSNATVKSQTSYAFLGDFNDAIDAVNHYNNNKSSSRFSYEILKTGSAESAKYSLKLGPFVDKSAAKKACESMLVDGKYCKYSE
jgi:hypothetical protein